MRSLFHRGEAYFSGVVKIIAFLEFKARLNIKYEFNPDGIKRKINSIGQAGQAKINIFQRSRFLKILYTARLDPAFFNKLNGYFFFCCAF